MIRDDARERAVELERFANGKRGGERQGNVARLVEMYIGSRRGSRVVRWVHAIDANACSAQGRERRSCWQGSSQKGLRKVSERSQKVRVREGHMPQMCGTHDFGLCVGPSETEGSRGVGFDTHAC